MFDESGIRFFFVFNTRLKVFHFLLDETEAVADELVPQQGIEPDRHRQAHGLCVLPVGQAENPDRRRTNGSPGSTPSLDGPFDQLPENFIEGDRLRDAMIAADPGVRGKIDRLGNFTDGSARFLVHPYMLYREVGDLSVFHRCVSSRAVKPADRPLCFVIGDDEAQRRNPRPLALKRR